MDNYYGPGQGQPNGILPRPQSHLRRPQPPQVAPIPHPQQQVEVEQVDDTNAEEDEDEFGGGDQERELRKRDSREAPRSRSRDSEGMNYPAASGSAAPKFLRIALIGDSTVGKTCLANAVTSESYSFNKNYHLTNGVVVHPKSVKLPEKDEFIVMALLDSSGKDIYLDFLPKCWDKLDGLVIVIDLTLQSSLDNAAEWLKLGMASCTEKGNGNSLGVLLGNKMEVTERRVITPEAAQEFANKYGLQYFECSVKENAGLEEPFFYLAHKWSTTHSDDNKENQHYK